ncbi:hypothetical protein [Massilia sp. TS11]|uniref:hypothetical protein n=1 Tax=Massilia sp. TS11 TaxID=2908003 RepID=UPI001EDAA78C|nr:hypothetical protein [Massilia sp. TS11]MCG2582795.1 hypothetical protein [Massilia sp. TS11]
MNKIRLAQLSFALAALGFTAAAPIVGLGSVAIAAESVRPEIGGPLTEAQKLMKANKHKEALAKLRELDSVGGKTPNEVYLIERTRAAAAAAAGDNEQAAKAFEALLSSGKLSKDEASKFNEGLIGIYTRMKAYDKANAAIAKSNDPKMRVYLIQNLIAMGKTAEAMKEIQQDISADEKAGRTPSKDNLTQLANLQNKTGDKAGYVKTIERLASAYPTTEVWTDLLQRVQADKNFSSRLAVDVYRLKFANGLLKKPSEYLEMGQLVIQSGANAEAVKVIDKGFKSGLLGSGADAQRHERLKALAEKNVAENAKNVATLQASLEKQKDNDGLAALGYQLVWAGKTQEGLTMMENAIKAGGMKYPDEAKLHLGIAYNVAGKKAQAISTWKSVGGNDGSAALARYWVMAANRGISG